MWISFRFGENAEKTGESGKGGRVGVGERGKWGENEGGMNFKFWLKFD